MVSVFNRKLPALLARGAAAALLILAMAVALGRLPDARMATAQGPAPGDLVAEQQRRHLGAVGYGGGRVGNPGRFGRRGGCGRVAG